MGWGYVIFCIHENGDKKWLLQKHIMYCGTFQTALCLECGTCQKKIVNKKQRIHEDTIFLMYLIMLP